MSRLFVSLSGLLSVILLVLPAFSVSLAACESIEVFDPMGSELEPGEVTLALPNGSKQRSRCEWQATQQVVTTPQAAASMKPCRHAQRPAAGLLSFCGRSNPLQC